MQAITSYTMDADNHITLFAGRTRVWEGSYEALVADGDVRPPAKIMNQIHDRAERVDACDCTRSGGPGAVCTCRPAWSSSLD